MIKLKVSKEKLLQWYADNNTGLMSKQVKAYFYEDWDNFIDCNDLDTTEKSMFKEYFEFSKPEPDYKDWISKDCVFWDEPFDDIINCDTYEGILIYFDLSGDKKLFLTNSQDTYNYCMLKKDYVKLIKDQMK